jgi:hypothetical protein
VTQQIFGDKNIVDEKIEIDIFVAKKRFSDSGKALY